jgi:hypothetical protein
VPQTLDEPDAVDRRRASVGLEPVDAYIRRAAEQFGPLEPARVACPACGGELKIWLPGPGAVTDVACPTCDRRMTVRGDRPGAPIPARARRLEAFDPVV